MAKATSKSTTSRPKLAKNDVKRSAPVRSNAPVVEPHKNIWVNISIEPSPLGGELLKQLKRAVGTQSILDERGSPKRAERASDAASAFCEALAYVPPQAAVEALAAATLIYSELDLVENGGTEQIRSAARERIAMRAASLASWIEYTHKIDRREWHLDNFCDGDARCRLIPHTANPLNVNVDHDA